MDQQLIEQIHLTLDEFVVWLEGYGETSYDHQSFFAGPLGGKAKALYYRKPFIGTLAVAPMIFCEALIPSARRFFWCKQRLPIADAHYAMGFALLSQVLSSEDCFRKAVHFLDALRETRCHSYSNYCWGYPFDWVTKNGTIRMGTPLITTTPYAYEAFLEVYKIDKKEEWLGILRSVAEHALQDIKDFKVSAIARTCSYTPHDEGGVVNASAYRAFLLSSASVLFSEPKYWEVAKGNLAFVLESQRADGSWPYSIHSNNDFVDHFHTCFVLKALAKIEQLKGHRGCSTAIDKGVTYYVANLFDQKGLPKPFSKAPRLTAYRKELYDYAECVNIAVLLRNRYPKLDEILDIVLRDLIARWRKSDGSFMSRQLYVGWDNLPMHRWAQSQLFRSLSFLAHQHKAGW